MIISSTHSTYIQNEPPSEGPSSTTSSQILLSRAVAEPINASTPSEPLADHSLTVASIFESESRHVMTLADAASSSSPTAGNTGSQFDEIQVDQHERLAETPANLQAESSLEPNESKVVDKEKGKSVERGRSSYRQQRYPNPLARAESERPGTHSTIEIDGRPVERRALSRSSTVFDDPDDPCAAFEDNLLEPCPDTLIPDTFSERLNSPFETPATTVGPIRAATHPMRKPTDTEEIPKLPRAVTTVSSNCQQLSPEPTHPGANFPQGRTNLSLLCLATDTPNSGQITPPSNSTMIASLASNLPTETIQQIYQYLSPADFNAARHICRTWFISSLDKVLLEMMLRRGGWYSSIQRDIAANYILDANTSVNDEWLMSKRISRECALGSDWSGNGLQGYGSLTPARTALVPIATVNFSEIAVTHKDTSSTGTIFTVSGCGRYLMAANGCLIYLYEMNADSNFRSASKVPGSLRAITSIICPRRVLACSMDTSSQRYAIAALLDGRMGLVCDISSQSLRPSNDFSSSKRAFSGNIPTRDSLGQSCSSKSSPGAVMLDRVSLNSSASTLFSGRVASEPPFVFPGIAGTPGEACDKPDSHNCFKNKSSDRQDVPPLGESSLPRSETRSGSRLRSTLPPEKGSSMPIETGPRSLYRNICSEDDPPQSVAICPQRRCVAFGCSLGIELHWVDALTGQDLNRWFPLTAPSDYLFFLPPRENVDSAKKLRLISSAARPGEKGPLNHRTWGYQNRHSPFWEKISNEPSSSLSVVLRLRGETDPVSASGRMESSDHFRAIPLSDGYHILFTDPGTGLLCMGSDAPIGGPTKLSRKIWFRGPEGHGSPVAYAAGWDVGWGVRIVAAFGTDTEQQIWFYSVPADVFAAVQAPKPAPSSFLVKEVPRNDNLEWLDWWPISSVEGWSSQIQYPKEGVLPRSVWPIEVRGQHIGLCTGLVDLVVDSSPAMVIWAFSKDGTAKAWHIDNGRWEIPRNSWVARDGTIRDVDGDGDVEMSEASASSPDSMEPLVPVSPYSPVFDTFDGSASVISLKSVRPGGWNGVDHGIVNLHSDGEVQIDDLSQSNHNSEDNFEALHFVENGYLKSWHSWNANVRIEHEHDPELVEVLVGITRIDIEIR